MDFEHFSISRDLFYLASLFAGAGLGCFLAALSSVRRGRSGWISAALCFLSCAVAALSGSIALSMGAVFKAFPLFVPSAVFFVAGVLALRFPRAGFALVFLAGVFAVFSGAAFLRYPRFSSPDDPAGAGNRLVMTIQPAGGGILVRKTPDPAGRAGSTDLAAEGESAETWNLAEGDPAGSLYFEAVAVQAHPLFPVFGGERRGFFSGAGRGDETLFSVRAPFFKAPAVPSPSLSAESSLPGTGSSVLGFTPRYFRTELPIRALFSGMRFSVVFSGEAFEFDPAPPDDF
ncbi:MAG: hypothetical protein LBP69_11050 [Treponema sp.]|jgi:hypothetical protein|nr:hypothetical protein [Treponema sp.]